MRVDQVLVFVEEYESAGSRPGINTQVHVQAILAVGYIGFLGTHLVALEEIGLVDAPESGIQVMTAAGAIQGEDGRLLPTAIFARWSNPR